MKCLPVNDTYDVCVTVAVKVVFKTTGSGELAEELLRKDTLLKAEHAGRQFETEIAEAVKERLLEPES